MEGKEEMCKSANVQICKSADSANPCYHHVSRFTFHVSSEALHVLDYLMVLRLPTFQSSILPIFQPDT